MVNASAPFVFSGKGLYFWFCISGRRPTGVKEFYGRGGISGLLVLFG